MSQYVAERLENNEIELLLAESHISAAGRSFFPVENYWHLSDISGNMPAPLNKVEQILALEKQPFFRLALARYASINSAHSVYNICTYMSMFANDYPELTDLLDPIQFISLKGKRGKSREYQLSTLRGFIRFWYHSGLWGVSDDWIKATNDLNFAGNEKGRAVKERDPFEGPYSQIEQQGIITEINNAYGANRLHITPYLITLMLLNHGWRSAQILQLRFKDFQKRGDYHWCKTPRAKQRGGTFRNEFTTYEVSEDLYDAVQIQKEFVLKKIKLPFDSAELPIFPNYDAFNSMPKSYEKIGEHHHETRGYIGSHLKTVEKIINVLSERTGERLNLTSRRFRRSLATDAAAGGYGLAVIATLLDHQDHQSAKVYTEIPAVAATRLDQKLGKMLAPLAQAFSGVIVKDNKTAIRGEDPTSLVRTDDGEEAVGNCGQMGFCGAAAPVACYTCVKFQAWRDAPHEDVLLQLYDERDEHLHITGDDKIASILDRTILAVEDVIRRCEMMKVGGDINE